jgi:hypothetical protein
MGGGTHLVPLRKRNQPFSRARAESVHAESSRSEAVQRCSGNECRMDRIGRGRVSLTQYEETEPSRT